MHIGVIGLDHWYTALGLLDDLKAHGDALPLAGVAEANAERAAWTRNKHPGVFVTGDYHELLARPDVGVVAICAATSDAPTIARAAIASGKHVISVKPPAFTLAELDGVIADAEQAGVFYGSFEGIQRLGDRARILREILQSGAIGRVMSFHQIGHGGLPSPWPGEVGPSWWTNAEKVPGGAWLDHAIYAVDLARFVLDGEVSETHALIENRVHADLSVEDYGATLMRLVPRAGSDGGENALIAGSASLLFEDTWTADAGVGFSQALFVGVKGTVRADGSAWVVKSGGTETRREIPSASFFRADRLAELLNAAPPARAFGPADARANLAACLAAYKR